MFCLNALLREIPSMEELLSADWARAFFAAAGRDGVKAALALALSDLRREIHGGFRPEPPLSELVRRRAESRLY
ncbi:MAG: L-seryl-tRNA(Sec) selenium transferase, partial [Spirochaetaceae bacterium]|nr:L-seryl-tRNA(Sec) selenium transferase [Spirochaetaceae bacterium]